jgi:uncharacterized membrane protein
VAKTVIGLMANLGDAQAVVRALVESGIAQDDIGFMANQKHQLPSTANLNESEGSGTLAGAGTGAALAGASLGALAGGLIGSLTNLGVPEEEAHYYAEAVRRGGIVITVAADKAAQTNVAVAIMRRHGAVDIDQRATEWKKQGWKGRFEASDEPAEQTHLPAVQEPQSLVRLEEAAYGARIYPKPAKRARRKTQRQAGKAA